MHARHEIHLSPVRARLRLFDICCSREAFAHVIDKRSEPSKNLLGFFGERGRTT